MVLREGPKIFRYFLAILVMATLTLSTSQEVKASELDQRIFSKAKRAFKNKQFETVISILRKRYNFKDPSTPFGALILAAYSYEKMGKLKNAQHTYTFLIKRRFKKINKKIIKTYRSSGTDDLPEAPNKLYGYYYKRGDLLSRIYVRDLKKMSQKRRQLYKETAKAYSEIVDDSDYEIKGNGDAEEIVARMDFADKTLKMEKFNWGYFASLHYITWRDKLTITTPSGASADIQSTAEGLCIGGGLKYENAWWQMNLNGCYASAFVTVGNDSQTVNYFQKNVPATAYFAGFGALWKPLAMDAAIGLNIPLIYRTGGYTEPPGYQLDNTSILSYGWLLEAQWDWKKYTYSLKFGKMNKFSSSTILIGGLYNF